jgi:hypothetical protein
MSFLRLCHCHFFVYICCCKNSSTQLSSFDDFVRKINWEIINDAHGAVDLRMRGEVYMTSSRDAQRTCLNNRTTVLLGHDLAYTDNRLPITRHRVVAVGLRRIRPQIYIHTYIHRVGGDN